MTDPRFRGVIRNNHKKLKFNENREIASDVLGLPSISYGSYDPI
jgi:hypothetical protein